MIKIIAEQEERKHLLARIHILKKESGIEDESYKYLLKEYNAESSKNLTIDELRQLALSLESWCEVKAKLSRQDKYILKLWNQLFEDGKTGSGSRQSLNKWIKRQTQVERLEWLTNNQKSTLINSMKRWLLRPHKDSR